MENESTQPLRPKTNRRVNRHLELAYMHVADSWFPANPELMTRIKDALNIGEFDNNRPGFIKELKKDVSLYLYCVKKLVELRTQANVKPTNESNLTPNSLIEQASLDELRQILTVPEESVSKHTLKDSQPLQARRLHQSVVSASVAEGLSGAHNVDSDLAFSCGLLRQLGLTLVAYNYPHVYRRAVLSLKPGQDLDQELNRMLGFSPSLLGVTIAKSWGLAPDLRRGIGDTELPPSEDEAKNAQLNFVAETLEKICKIGEAFARATDPSPGPDATKDWEFAQNEIERSLGKNGIEYLKQKIQESCQYYVKTAPEIFKFPAAETTSLETKAITISASNNTYLVHCPPGIRERLTKLYETMDGQTISRENIDLLIKEIIPEAGFKRGCIYLLEPETFKLIPRLGVGDISLSRFKSVNYAFGATEYDPIASAYRCSSPIMDENVEFMGEKVSYIVGSLGGWQRAGVLYLEISDELEKKKILSPLLIYKAIRQTLNDCLGLR